MLMHEIKRTMEINLWSKILLTKTKTQFCKVSEQLFKYHFENRAYWDS